MKYEAKYIGSCGCYCKTCPELAKGLCKGCKLGYDSGERDINKAKCKIKLCCFKDKKLETCADCPEHLSCELIGGRFKDYRLRKCLEIMRYINDHGYDGFMRAAKDWKNAYGKLPKA